MGLIKIYKSNFLIRFDKDEAIPYYSYQDFNHLSYEENSFINSLGIEVKYYFYSYDGYNKDRIILFCPGIGPGHTSYLTEIELLCKAGYRVLTLDYTGCGDSKGETLPSINQPTKDIIELLNLLNLKEKVILIGHSLGGYTSLNVIHQVASIKKAVIISGFIDIASEMLGFVGGVHLLANIVKRYENKLNPEYKKFNNWQYLKNTEDNIFFLHSKDDPMVSFKYNTLKVMKYNNPHLKFYICEGKKHNPNYSKEGLDYMNMAIGGYNSLLAKGELKTIEEKKQYFSDKPIGKMTAQDDAVWNKILEFIK